MTAAVPSAIRFVWTQVRQALQQVAAIGACSPYFAAASLRRSLRRPVEITFMLEVYDWEIALEFAGTDKVAGPPGCKSCTPQGRMGASRRCRAPRRAPRLRAGPHRPLTSHRWGPAQWITVLLSERERDGPRGLPGSKCARPYLLPSPRQVM